jgi:hypothetical protein
LPQGWKARKREAGLPEQAASPPLLRPRRRRICCGRHSAGLGGSGPEFPDTQAGDAMIDKPDTDRNGGHAGREMRLRVALRENLKRRKAQIRGRADQAAATERSDSECQGKSH